VDMDYAAAASLDEAALLRLAAELIRSHGYNPSKPADSGPGHSLSTALCAVTGCDPAGRHIRPCEGLHDRVAGYLFLTGRATAGRTYLPGVLEVWEDYSPGEGWRSQDEAISVLDHAAAILTQAGDEIPAPRA
jgi:hypothetical protein